MISAADALFRLIRPLEDALTSSDELVSFFAEFGWQIDPSVSVDEVSRAIGITSLLDEARTTLSEIGADPTAAEYADVIDVLEEVIARLRELASGTSTPSGVDAAAWRDVVGQLLSYLVLSYVESRHPVVYAALIALGVVDETEQPASDGRSAYTARSVDWSRLSSSLGDPVASMRERFGWGTSLDHDALVRAAARVFGLLGLSVTLETPAPSTLDRWFSSTNSSRSDVRALRSSLISGEDEAGNSVAVEVSVLPIPPSTARDAAPDGLGVAPAMNVTGSAPASVWWPYSVDIDGGFESGLSVDIHPTGSTVTSTASTVDSRIQLTWQLPGWALLAGSRYAQRLEVRAYHISCQLSGETSDPEFLLEFGLDEARLILETSDADSFVTSALGVTSTTVDINSALEWSSKSGIRFAGQGELELTIPLNLTIGAVAIDTLTIRLAAATGATSLSAGVSGGLALGPIAVSVQELGIQVVASPRSSDEEAGNLGDLDLTFGFKPPDGLGLVIDAGVVTGGGYLYFDSEAGEYAGVAELSVQDLFALTVIGIVTTELPDGSEGYSFLLIVAAEFQPIQLGFGFTLNGVGGLAAINRTMLTDVLAAGIRDHTLDSILFPEDPVANAPRIISDLESVFPVDEGRYVFGPMLEIGWGTPSLITAELGVFMELPEPIRIVILGQLAALLPSADAPLVEIHLDSVGVIDFEAGTLSIDASLYDSKILAYALSGDMALRAETGDDPSFALSVGGLNPHFDPPAGFPELRRLTLSLGTGNNPRLSCESYLALTSNTVQFGAGVDAYAEAAGFAVKGHLGFDVLFVLSPFSFIADMDADVALLKGDIELMSVALDVSLAGPTPWQADGKATAKVCGFKVSVSFDVTWGDREDAELPSSDARTPLLAALADERSWVAALPADTETGATLGALAASEGAILVHPLGSLTVTQTVAPLNVSIERFGSTTPRDWDRFEISAVELGDAATTTSTVEDHFAPAQFFALSDSEKLSSPSYEEMDAGVAIGSADAAGGASATLEVEYEEYIVDDRALPARFLGLYTMSATVFGSLLRQGAGELSLVRATGSKKYVPVGTASPIATESVRHVVTSTTDLSLRTDIVAAGTSRVAAAAALEAYLALHPEERGALQVVPAFEAAA